MVVPLLLLALVVVPLVLDQVPLALVVVPLPVVEPLPVEADAVVAVAASGGTLVAAP